MTMVQELDRDLLAYTADKPRQPHGNTEEPSNSDERIPTKPANFPGPSSPHGQRDSKQLDDDDVKDRVRVNNRERLRSRDEDTDEITRDHDQDKEQVQEREHVSHNKPDGSGPRSDIDSQFRNTTTGRRERIPITPISDDLRVIKSLGMQPSEHLTRKSYPSSPATSTDPSSANTVIKADAASDELEDAVIKQEPSGVVGTPLAQTEESTTLSHGDDSVSANGYVATLDSDEVNLAGGPTVASLLSPRLSPVPEAADSVPKEEEEEDEEEEEEEFEKHGDILVEIDKIDGKIQHLEDLLLKHRIQKEQPEAEITGVVDTVQDEDVPIDIEKADAKPMVDETMMEVDEEVVLVTGKTLHDDAKDADPVMDGEDDALSPVDLVPDRDIEDSRLDVIDSEDVDMNASDNEMSKNKRRQIIRQFSRQELQQPIDEDDPFYRRKNQQTRRPQLYDQIYAENNTRAKKYGRVHSHSATGTSRHTAHPHHHHRLDQDKSQIYESVEDYPCYQENIDSHNRLRGVLLHSMAMKATALDEKELELKREYKQYWETWTKKVEKLDKIKEKMSNAPLPTNVREEDLVQSDNVLFTTRNRRGTYNSDAVRSEAELLEIIQSLENADMRNPDLRASRTAATVPPMILDPNIREKVHYYDRNHLVTDPAKHYRLGPVTDVWTEEERQTFIKRYLNHPKQFGKIAAGLENKTACQCVLFYYREKKKIGFKDILSNRGRKRKPAAGKRKEKAAQQGSPSGQPGKKSKGSALIEDIGQANRKTAKSKEIRELQDMKQSWGDFDPEPGTRRRVRSGAVGQHGINPGIEDSNNNAASPVPSSAVSTPIISSVMERRKQRTKGTTTRSSAASNAKALAEDVVVEEKKPKADKLSSAAASANAKATPKSDETFISVDSPTANPVATTNQTPEVATEQSLEILPPTTATPAPSGPARWTPAEHTKCIAALKKYGRDFEAVANAVGTKTVDQCKNYCFNYKRRFGVSALDDANSLDLSELGEEGEDKDGTGAGVEKNKARKGRSANPVSVSAPGTPSSTTAGVTKDGATTPAGRRRAKPIVQDTVKDDAAKPPSEKAINVEESESAGDKKRRKRVASKSEASGTPTEVVPTPAASLRALYSRDLPSESSSPSLPAPPQAEDAPSPGVVSVDGSARKSAFSSYWSRQERIDFVRLLSVHGKDWEKISKALKTKTAIQVRNHYSNNAEKLAADGVIGMERTVSPVPPSIDNGEQFPESVSAQTHQQPQEGGYIDQDLADHVVEHGVTGQPAERAYHSPVGAGPKSGYFMPPSHVDDRTESSQMEEPRSATPPRRITNIGNLLNNDDEDVNVAVEDWFGGNSEEGSNPSQEHSFEADGQPEQELMRRQFRSYDNNQARVEDEDVETEDECYVIKSKARVGSGYLSRET
ncbi:hypothetical protein BGZ58_004417 [Dissophora ornata]|nr:hypothetical protein BGZ58_004417 [Dissophora ornata]